ncbi:MAG: hypothetical protein HC892_23365 [Saprospiraceae bacterium]|nr:hypothetical protein [Saprospiraceae bacterium]
MRKFYCSLLIIVLALSACQQDKTNWKPLDLLAYGVPMTIEVPIDSPQIKTSNGLLGEKEVIVKAGNGFDLLITYQAAGTSDMTQLKATQIDYVKDIPNFSKIIEEQPDGFIYETVVDSSNVFYGFRYIRLQGDNQYVFQSGMIGAFTLDEAKQMYQAVQAN